MELKSVFGSFWGKIRSNKLIDGHRRVLLIAAGGLLLLFLIFRMIFGFLDHGIKLVAMDPADDINIKTNLTFTFSGDAVEEREVGVTVTDRLIKFTPAIPGRFRWISRRELRFLPETPFLPSTEYQADLQTGLVKVKERYLSGNRAVKFNTGLFKVESVSIGFVYPEGQKKGLRLQANLQFNYPVTAAELQKALELRFTKNERPIGFNLSASVGGNNLVATSELLQPEDKDKEVELVIPKGFRCRGGNIGLAETFSEKTVLGAKKPLTIIEAAPKNSDTHCWIAVHCSDIADAKSLAGFIRIKPEVPFKVAVEGDYINIKSDKFKSGANFQIRLAPGLPSLNGYPLKREYAATVFFTDLEPSLKFNAPGRYLSSKGNLNLGLETVNIDRVNLEISQIYANNIVSYLHDASNDNYVYSGYIPRMGRVVESSLININGPKNELVTTPINLREYLKDNFRGILQVVVSSDDERWFRDAKYVIVTDLGIVGKMGRDELMVWVNSLAAMEPKPKTKVSLISRNNQVMATAFTDRQGVARFKNIKKTRAEFEPYIILAELGDDFAFVQFEQGLIETADFDIRGRRHLVDGYEAFLYLDRDIFRPGDQGNLVAVIRGPNAGMPPEFPVKLEVKQPDGQIYKELKSNTADRGMCEFAITVPDYAQTGRYQANLRIADEIVGSASFSVEDFMPERIKVTAKTDQPEYYAGNKARVSVTGVNLFGPPAAGRRSELKVKLEPVEFTAAGYNSYTFGDPEQAFSPKEQELGEIKLDDDGVAVYNYEFPKELTPPAKLRALFHATVLEDGGRAVSSYQAVDLHAYQRYIGIKALSRENYCELNKPFPIKYVVVDTHGKPVEKTRLSLEVYRITWNSVYRKTESGRYEYVSEEEKTRVYSGTLTAEKGEQSYQYVPKDYGRYQIVLKDPASPSRAAVSFYAEGWGYTPWTMDAPEKVKLETDRKTYKVGEQAKIEVKAPFSGKALVTVEREQVYDYQVVEFKENTGVVTIPVKEEYKPNVYVSLHLIRSIKSLEKRAPARAFGIVPLTVDCLAHKLDLKLQAAAEIRPRHELEVSVKIDRSAANAYLTLAAVDEGICQLTNYAVPDPVKYFYGKRSLNIESYDLYGMILPEVESAPAKSSPGGDADLDGVRRRNLNPVAVKRVKPLSLWSGVVKVDRNGEARVKLQVPQFNGTLRLMAVAASGNRFGSAQKKIIVRDPIVITPTFPRFVAGGDRFSVPVGVVNGTGKAGCFQITLGAKGPVEIVGASRQALSLKNQEEQMVFFELKAKNSTGKLAFTLQARGNQATCEITEELALRPSVPLTQEYKSGAITAKRPMTVVPASDWLPGTASYQLTLAPLPGLKFAGSLRYLLGYPHGCVEQTTSKLFPLLYFDSLAEATQNEVFKGGNADYYIGQGIEKLEAMQLRDGSFSYWPGDSYSNEWGSVYAANFLVEARKAGYSVADRVYDKMLKYLLNLSRVSDSSKERLQTRIYALYVLSLAGKTQLSTMAYLKNLALDKLDEASQAQLAAAYYYSGDRQTAKQLLPATLTPSVAGRQTGGNFNSAVRDDAIILGALADIEPGNPVIFKLVSRLGKAAKPGYWGNTQENAFALMALGKIYKKKTESDYQGEVWVDNQKIAAFDSQKITTLKDSRLGKGRIRVKISGKGECYYHLTACGIPARNDVKEYSRGISVTREYLDRHGDRQNPAHIRQGDLIVAHLTIRPDQDGLDNIAIVDMLPGGLEIDNPRLAGNAGLTWISEKSLVPGYLDVRDDRLILFVNLSKSGTYHFYYALRAVSCGEFILPSVKAECMYEPEIGSYASSGQITVGRE
jgi:uncharacterized protein YfaS (alpha-2-macroglobulin family)